MAEKGHLPPGDIRRVKASATMEHGAPMKILLVEIMRRTMTLPNFPVYLILLQLLVLIRQFLLQYFMYLFKPKGTSTFLQTHGFLFLIFGHNLFYCLNSYKSTRWTDQLKRVKILTSPQSVRITQKRVKVLTVHKVGGLTRRG